MKNKSTNFKILLSLVLFSSITLILIDIEILRDEYLVNEKDVVGENLYPDIIFMILSIGFLLEAIIVPFLVILTIYLFKSKRFLSKRQRYIFLSSVLFHILLFIPIIYRFFNPILIL